MIPLIHAPVPFAIGTDDTPRIICRSNGDVTIGNEESDLNTNKPPEVVFLDIWDLGIYIFYKLSVFTGTCWPAMDVAFGSNVSAPPELLKSGPYNISP